MSKVQVTSRFAVALAVLALAAGGCRDRGQALEAGAAKAPPAVVLAKDGLTAYTIVTGAQPLLAEQTAAKELAEYLGKVTGAEFKTVAENATGPQPAKAIYLGWTAFAASKGIECAKLGQEESVIRTVGDSLVITGGRPRGTIYGVYDFLQKDLGVYWLDHQTEVVPKRPTLALDALDRRAKPGFFYRHLYDVFLMGGGPFWPADPEMRQKVASFSARNRLNDKGRRFVAAMRPYGGVETYGSSYPVGHNFHFFVPGEKYFAEHPEYFAQDKSGKRQSCTGHNKGSLCLTHPEVRKIALARLLDVIAADRKEFPPGTPASPDQPPPSIYHFNQPDNDVVCHCPGCREMVAREGSESGPLIDFVNELADGVRDRYPEVRVMTAAYWWGMVPPKTLRPRDNVIIHWCNWYGFPGSNIPEPWQPLSSAVNAVRAENLRQWSAIAPGGLLIVEYGDCYTWPGFPFTSAPLLADNIRFLADNHAVGLWLHSEMHMPWEVNNERRGAEFFAYANGQFSPLYYWLAMQLMLDPRQPVEPLIATFMAGYYGPAAPTMRSLYDKLVAAQRALPARGQRGPWDNIAKADYVTPAFFAEVDALLEKAEAACAPDSPELRHVQYERLRSDSSLLSAWAKLKTRLAPGAAMPFDREAVITRIETRAWPVMEALGYPEKAKGGGLYSAFGGGSLDNRIKNWRADSGQGQAPEAASQKVPGLPPVGPELSIAPVAGRYVRIERRNQYLCIAEVQVSSGGQNVALRKKATQSSLSEWGGSPERAVDGNTSGNWADGSVTHTRNGPNEWWEVDLGQNCPIESIAYYDRANHQSDWVPGTDVIILDENRKVVWRRTIETRLDGKGDRIVF